MSREAVAWPGLAQRARAWLRPRALLDAFKATPKLPTIILAILMFFAIFGDLFEVWIGASPVRGSLRVALVEPVWLGGEGSSRALAGVGGTQFLLGADNQGRDILVRLIAGARISVIVGFLSVGVAGCVGTTVAVVSGYMGKWVDIILMRVTDVFLSIPFLLLALTLAAILSPSLENLIFILGGVLWTSYARILRSEVLRIKGLDFISLAKISGASTPRILFRHIFPNVANSLIVVATLQLGTAILAEAALSFLGLGVPPPTPSWGSMLADGRQYIRSAWWIALFPGLAITLTVLATNRFGDWLRLRLDPKYRQL